MLRVATFGEIAIEYKNKLIKASDFKSDMLIKLFIYLIVHRGGAVETDAICRELWPNGESSNPTGALKNLTYRLRVFLKEYYPEDEFIVTSRGSYRFNPEIKCEVDSEVFDTLTEKIKFTADNEKAENELFDAVELYKGDYLSEISDMRSVIMQRAYYHSQYVFVTKQICELLVNSGRYVELYELCKKIIMIERLEEEIYYYLILSCAYTGNILVGLEIYDKAVKLLKKELGVSNFELLNEAYEKILVLRREEDISDIGELKSHLLESREPGPFICDYYEFKEIYQLIIRQRGIRENPGILVLFTIEFSFAPEKSKLDRFRAEKISKEFVKNLAKSLRMGDVISKYSERQILVILTGCDEDNSIVVIDRIKNKFVSDYPQYSEAKITAQRDAIVSIV